MRITKSISGFTEINYKATPFFELKVVAQYSERKKLGELAKKVEKFVEDYESEKNGQGQDSTN